MPKKAKKPKSRRVAKKSAKSVTLAEQNPAAVDVEALVKIFVNKMKKKKEAGGH
jgi:hypothetical protein